MPHAVSRLRDVCLARSAKPPTARRASMRLRCVACRVAASHCLCVLRPAMPTRAGVCLLMADMEPTKPSNTGWLVADMVADTFAFGWARTQVDPALLALLRDPQWQPYVVFPADRVAPERVVQAVDPAPVAAGLAGGRRPLFVLLDGTWSEAHKMFGRSPYLDAFPVLSLQPDGVSRYQLRCSRRSGQLCTSEVAALCLALAGDVRAAQALEAYLAVFTHHYLRAKNQQPIVWDSAAHQNLRALSAPAQ